MVEVASVAPVVHEGRERLVACRRRLRREVEADVASGGVDRVEALAAAEAWLAGAPGVLEVLCSGLEGVSGSVVGERLRAVSVVADRVQVAVARLSGALDASAQWSVEGSPSARAWLVANTGVGKAAASRSVGVGRLVARFAATAAAVADGELSAAQAEVLAGTVLAKGRDRLFVRDEAVLLAAADELSVSDFAVVVRRWGHLADDELDDGEPVAALARRGLSFADLPSGNVRVAGELDATGGSFLRSAFLAWDRPDPIDDESCPPRTLPQRRADFVSALAARFLSESNAGASAPVATVDVVVDAEVLAHIARRGQDQGQGATPAGHDHDDARAGPEPRSPSSPPVRSAGGRRVHRADGSTGVGRLGLVGWCDAIGSGPRPAHTVVQLLCDSWIGRVAMTGRGEVLDVGRRTRTWSPAQRRAIVVRDGHCTHGTCTRGPEWCQIHHVDPWDPVGETNIDNGTLRCLWHHTHHHAHSQGARAPTCC